jgi:hypothetical protein
MKLKKLTSRAIMLVLFLGFSTSVISQEKKELSEANSKEVEVKVTYCNLRLAEVWKLGNLTFNSVYTFRVNAHGKPVELKKLRDDFIGIDVVSSCISKWEIKGVSTSTTFGVSFTWKHGKGWVDQSFSGGGFTHTMTSSGVGVE